MMGNTQYALVIGAGITGLVCAFRLQQSGIPVMLLDAADSAGGAIATWEKNGFLFEAGPQCPRFPQPLWDLVREIGLEGEFVRGDSRARRYILKNGRLHVAPFSPFSFAFTGLVGVGSKYRLLTEIFRRSRPPRDEESLAQLVRRKFDGEVLHYLVDPFIAAIFAGDSQKIGVESAFPFLARWEREYGSLLRGALRSRNGKSPSDSRDKSLPQGTRTRQNSLVVTESLPSLGSFRAGLGALPKKLAQRLGDSICLRARVQNVESGETREDRDSAWKLRLGDGEVLSGAALVMATPAYEAARLLQNAAPELSTMLSDISYAPMAVVSSGYHRAQVRNPLRGFGVMIPRREKLSTIFNVWNSSVLDGRAPAGKVLITSFAGGAANPALVEKDDTSIAAIVESEMGAVLGIDGAPVERFVWKHSKALPQFNLGHARTVAGIRKALAGLPGLYLAGNYLEGRSLGDCIESGSRTAEEVAANFSNVTSNSESGAMTRGSN
jgi:protoporphyrinogen/coproporphyrinogen III oxidase